jgi:RNA polymerase sigma-70 factor, ECF subfamily
MRRLVRPPPSSAGPWPGPTATATADARPGATAPAFESSIRDQVRHGAHEAATSAIVRTWGPEILGFLIQTMRDEALARDAFSWFCESLWRGLPGFRWEASLRTWCYVLARRSVARVLRDRTAVRECLLSSGKLDALAESVTTSALPVYRAQLARGIAALRAELTETERMLLTLRIDRELSWREIAIVMGDHDETLSPPTERIESDAATLRKRYERTKLKLHRLARERGLIHR